MKLKRDKLLSNFAFNFNMRHYTKVSMSQVLIEDLLDIGQQMELDASVQAGGLMTLVPHSFSAQLKSGQAPKHSRHSSCLKHSNSFQVGHLKHLTRGGLIK